MKEWEMWLFAGCIIAALSSLFIVQGQAELCHVEDCENSYYGCEIKVIKDRISDYLFSIDNVTGVGTGADYIMVHVTELTPENQRRIPQIICGYRVKVGLAGPTISQL